MSLVVQFSEQKPVPEGIYIARLESAEPQPPGKYGPSIRWVFIITDPRFPNLANTARVNGITSMACSPKTKAHEWIRAFGHEVGVGEQFDVHTLIGKEVKIKVKNVVSARNNGFVTYANVDKLAPIKTAATPAATQAPAVAQAEPEPETASLQFSQPKFSQPILNVTANPVNRPVVQNVVPQASLDEDEDFNF